MPPFSINDVGNLTAAALWVWYAWHTATRTLPALVRSFRAELAAQREQWIEEREAWRQELAEERAQRHADSVSLLEGLQALGRQMAMGTEACRAAGDHQGLRR